MLRNVNKKTKKKPYIAKTIIWSWEIVQKFSLTPTVHIQDWFYYFHTCCTWHYELVLFITTRPMVVIKEQSEFLSRLWNYPLNSQGLFSDPKSFSIIVSQVSDCSAINSAYVMWLCRSHLVKLHIYVLGLDKDWPNE